MLFCLHFEIGIYPNRVQIHDPRTGLFVDQSAEVPFSQPDHLVADPIYFEYAVARAVRKAMSGGFILYDARADVVAGAAEMGEDDRRTVVKVLIDIGFKTITFPDDHGSGVVPMAPAPLSIVS